MAGRRAWANDLNPYAHVLTRGKLEAPLDQKDALQRTLTALDMIEREAGTVDLSSVPDWVKEFFHPDTLREVITAFRLFLRNEDHFLASCLLGILHHQRPGFLSYPASHLVPYLRTEKFPRGSFPEMYGYRDLRSRLLSKVKRAYRRPKLPPNWEHRDYQAWQEELPWNSPLRMKRSTPSFRALRILGHWIMPVTIGCGCGSSDATTGRYLTGR